LAELSEHIPEESFNAQYYDLFMYASIFH
jgi:hypothetical protein